MGTVPEGIRRRLQQLGEADGSIKELARRIDYSERNLYNFKNGYTEGLSWQFFQGWLDRDDHPLNFNWFFYGHGQMYYTDQADQDQISQQCQEAVQQCRRQLQQLTADHMELQAKYSRLLEEMSGRG